MFPKTDNEKRLNREYGKTRLLDHMDRQQIPVPTVDFENEGLHGFVMLFDTQPAVFKAMLHSIPAMGFACQTRRVQRQADVWHYEVQVLVPEDWEPTPLVDD